MPTPSLRRLVGLLVRASRQPALQLAPRNDRIAEAHPTSIEHTF
jgi:hypothetical protein